MKKILFVLFTLTFISFFCFTRLPSAKAEETKTFIGKIESFKPVLGRPPKWTFAKFTAVADNGEKKEIWILGVSGVSPTSVTDLDGKPMDKSGYNHRPQVGKKVDVKYSTAENGRDEAISIRYVPLGYVQPPIAPANTALETITNVSGTNIFVGKVLKGGVTFSLRCPYRFIIVTDNGEKKDIWIPRGNLRITDVNGKSVYGAPPRAGKKMEVKYLIGDNSQYEAVSMRYVPLDYVLPANVPLEVAQPVQGTTTRTGNTFTGINRQ